MPLFDYWCPNPDCGRRRKDVLVGSTRARVICPSCRTVMARALSMPAAFPGAESWRDPEARAVRHAVTRDLAKGRK